VGKTESLQQQQLQDFGAGLGCRTWVQDFGAGLWCRTLVQDFGAGLWCNWAVKKPTPES
jgi:hypothetical protein